jgi:lysophospholipase L1-like esterase
MADFHVAANGQYGEISQIQSGVLSSDTTLVLLSAGGNDANFSGVVQDCAMSADCTGGESTYQGGIDYAEQQVSALIEDIHVRAPNARVVLVGYPHLFTDTNGGCDTVFTLGEVRMLNRLSDYMNTAATATAADNDAGYVDMRAAITPSVCAAGSHLIGISTDNSGPGDFQDDKADSSDNQACPLHWAVLVDDTCLSRSSFHPNSAGAADYTAHVTSQLPAVGYP